MFCMGFFPKVGQTIENYMVNVRDFVCKQTLITNELCSYWSSQTLVLANQLVQKLCACTVVQVLYKFSVSLDADGMGKRNVFTVLAFQRALMSSVY